MNWLSKLLGREKRRSRRHLDPPLMAFYWDGGLSSPHAVPDISHDGVFVSTDDRWYPDTMVRLILQRNSEDSQKSEESITVQCRVVRAGDEGVGMAIMFAGRDKSDSPESSRSLATRKQFKKFIEHLVKDTTESQMAESPHLAFSVLGPMTDPSSPDRRTAGQENAKQDDARRPEHDSPGPSSG